MKHKMKRKSLLSKEDIWNAVFAVISEYDFPTANKVVNELFIASQYYSELESGGHESLFTWFAEYIEEVGIFNFLKELIDVLEKIGAHDYAKIEKKYGEDIWQLLSALENDEIEEHEFYKVVDEANREFYALKGSLGNLLELYFVNTYTELIKVIDD